MDNAALHNLFEEVAGGVRSTLTGLDDWSLAGTRDGQYRHDLAADEVALNILFDAGVGVLSEESGLHNADADVIVVIDPVDGSTNASIGLPWYAISLCAVREGAAVAALVKNLAVGTTFLAARGQGALMDGKAIRSGSATAISESILGINGLAPAHLGWQQFRALGATALDLSFVAAGRLDGYLDCTRDELAPWDYLGAMLICEEAGAQCVDAFGRDLIVLDHSARRSVIGAATPELLEALLDARLQFDP